LLHEFEKIKKDFSAGDFGGIHSFKRTRTIMKTLVGQIDILETMTPSSFSSFRDRPRRRQDFSPSSSANSNFFSDTNARRRLIT